VIHGNSLEGYDIVYYGQPALRGTIRVAALDRGHALILLPDRILEFEASSGTAHTALSLPESHLTRFVNMTDGGDVSILVAGSGGLGRMHRKDALTWQWKAFPRPPAHYWAFRLSFKGSGQ
jgi:hypothetical protein